MIVVLNEWIFHDLQGDNGPERRRRTRAFMEAFESSSDRLVIPNEPRWLRKAYGLMRRQEPEGKAVGKLVRRMLSNPKLAVQVETDAAPIPEDLLRETPSEDIYLVEAYLSAGADTLVTTDEGLHGALADFAVVDCLLRDDFLAGYPPDA